MMLASKSFSFSFSSEYHFLLRCLLVTFFRFVFDFGTVYLFDVWFNYTENIDKTTMSMNGVEQAFDGWKSLIIAMVALSLMFTYIEPLWEKMRHTSFADFITPKHKEIKINRTKDKLKF